jgi:protein required for attachment to host cells
MKKDTWLIIANSSLARIFKVDKGQTLVELKKMEHPESRLHARDMTTDRPGREFDSFGYGRHAMESPSPKQHEFELFAREIAQFLEKARLEGHFERLYLAANPTLLGLLRQHLNPATAKLLCGEVDKDMTHMVPTEIVSHLPFVLRLA